MIAVSARSSVQSALYLSRVCTSVGGIILNSFASSLGARDVGDVGDVDVVVAIVVVVRGCCSSSTRLSITFVATVMGRAPGGASRCPS